MSKNSDKHCRDFTQKSFHFKEIEWKIHDVLSLPDTVGYKLQSPSFEFADATWEIQMCPNGRSQESEGYIDIAIKRMNSRIPQQYVFYKFCFKTRKKGKEYEIRSHSSLFNSDCECWQITNYLKKSKFVEMKNVIAANGILTISCQIRTKMIEQFRTHSATESNVPQLSNSVKSNFSAYLPNYKILSDFKELFLKLEDCDVVIKVKGKEFLAHRLILKARSPVFASTFRNDMKEKSTGVIDIEDCDPSTFSNFLSFLYSGDEGNLSVENVFSLFTTADKYDVQDLRKKCLIFMKENLSLDTFCDTIGLALQHSEMDLVTLCTDFFAKNLQEVIVTVEWQQFLANNPTVSNELLIKALAPNKSSK